MPEDCLGWHIDWTTLKYTCPECVEKNRLRAIEAKKEKERIRREKNAPRCQGCGKPRIDNSKGWHTNVSTWDWTDTCPECVEKKKFCNSCGKAMPGYPLHMRSDWAALESTCSECVKSRSRSTPRATLEGAPSAEGILREIAGEVGIKGARMLREIAGKVKKAAIKGARMLREIAGKCGELDFSDFYLYDDEEGL